MHRSLEPFHGLVYFAPEATEAYRRLGTDDYHVGSFGSRAAALGPVPAEVVTALFCNFHPDVVTAAIATAWVVAEPEAWVEARHRGIDGALRRILGDELEGTSMVQAAALAKEATNACSCVGRALYAAHRSLDWPEQPHVVLWHALSLLREHRGDGHVACLVEAEIGGCEALVLHAGTGEGHLGEQRSLELRELVRPMSRSIVASGAFGSGA
jgi:hypothetical protein